MAKTIPLVECWKFVGSTPKKYEGKKRYVSTGALEKDHINEADVENVTYEERPSRANLEAVAGDILFAKMASTEKTFVVDDVSAENIYSTGFCAVRADETKILPKCLYYFLSSPLFLEQKDKNSSGATQKAITNAGLAKITIKLPTLADQLMFVMQMDLLTDLISARKAQLEKLDQLVKSRFIELFGTVTENPYGFPMATLKEACYKITDGKHGGCEQEADSGYYYVGAREIYDDCIHYDTAPQITYADFVKDYKRCNIERGDMVIVNTGATIGKTAIAKSPLTERTLLQKSVALLKVKTEIISAEFLRHCYVANPSMYKVESASAQPNLLLSKMNATRIYLPPIKLQEQFAAFVEQTDKSKLAIQQSLDKLELLKKSLMQEYFE